MTPGAQTSWRALDPAGEAMAIRGRPAHAFWPLLAPSFRWVLLPPHRRAGGGEIAWEWQGPCPAPRPSTADLNDLRLRLRDGIELLEEELSRRDTLPEGLSAEDLRKGIDQTLHNIRHGPDPVLAAHAVLTSRGWMVRSWGFAHPAPAQAEAEETAEPPAEPTSAPVKTAAVSPRRAPRDWRVLRRWLAALLLGALALGVVSGLRALRPNNNPRATEAPPLPETSLTHPAPPAKAETAAESNAPVISAGAATKEVQSTRAAPSSPRNSTRASPIEQAREPATTPLAITGPMPASSEAQVSLAGPPSKVPGKTGQPPVLALPRGGAPMGTPPPGKTGPDMAPPPPHPAPVSTTGEDAPAARAPPPTPSSPVGEHREGKHAAAPTNPVAPAPFLIEAREAPGPTRPPAPKPRSTSKAGKAPPSTAAVEEALPSARSAKPPRTSDSAPDDASPPQSAHAAARVSGAIAEGRPVAPSTAGLETVFRGHAMPWRLVLERDAPLPTKPTEQDAEAEMRAARIAAWAEARARMPLAFRKREGRAGWSLRLAAEAPTAGHARWLDASGSVLPAEQASLANGEARIAWREDDTRDVDAMLVTEAGAALARVRRLVAENRIEIQAAPAVLELRAWFSLKLKADAGDEGLAAPAGWSLGTEDGELIARGPPGALRMRWQHGASGWTLHGGYARENP